MFYRKMWVFDVWNIISFLNQVIKFITNIHVVRDTSALSKYYFYCDTNKNAHSQIFPTQFEMFLKCSGNYNIYNLISLTTPPFKIPLYVPRRIGVFLDWFQILYFKTSFEWSPLQCSYKITLNSFYLTCMFMYTT